MMRLSRSLGLVIALACGEGPQARAQTLHQKLDSIASENLQRDKAVGAVVMVVRGSDTLFAKTYGRADREANVAMHRDAVFGIGSITKQFTAAAILQLRDQGKLSLDDDVTKWLPDFDTGGNKVIVRHLMNHTSGIPDVSRMPEWRGLVRNASLPRDSLYAVLRRKPFEFPTGTRSEYTNSAFWLLHLIVEKASGMPYPRYVETKLFAPLNMNSSGFCLSESQYPRRAVGYGVRSGEVRRAPLNVSTWYMGSGVLCSTAEDMLRWLSALHGGKVVSSSSYREMIAPTKLADGSVTRYGLGLEVAKDARGTAFIGHSGEIAGYAARANWYPDANLSIVVLMNNSIDASPTAMAAELAAAVLASHGKPSAVTK